MTTILEYKGCVDRSRPSDLYILLLQSLFLGRLFPDLGPWWFFSSFLLIILPHTWRSCSPTVIKALTIPQLPKAKRPDNILGKKKLGNISFHVACSMVGGLLVSRDRGDQDMQTLHEMNFPDKSVRAKSTNSQSRSCPHSLILTPKLKRPRIGNREHTIFKTPKQDKLIALSRMGAC